MSLSILHLAKGYWQLELQKMYIVVRKENVHI